MTDGQMNISVQDDERVRRKRAEGQGHIAHELGKTLNDNPYDQVVSKEQYDAWRHGWERSQGVL